MTAPSAPDSLEKGVRLFQGEGVSGVVYEQMSAFSHSQPSPHPLSLAAQAILVATRAMLVPEGERLSRRIVNSP